MVKVVMAALRISPGARADRPGFEKAQRLLRQQSVERSPRERSLVSLCIQKPKLFSCRQPENSRIIFIRYPPANAKPPLMSSPTRRQISSLFSRCCQSAT